MEHSQRRRDGPAGPHPAEAGEVEHLYHSYGHNDRFQVHDVTFQVAEGEIFGFLGPNGAGKSTTQKILTGLLSLQRGEVEIAGVDIRRPSRQLLNLIGVSFEQPNLYRKLSGLENLQFHRGLYDVPTEDPRQLLKRFGLEDAANKRAGAYSKGMQQRLVLARSLLNRPRLWFLNEPTAGLDPATAQEVKQLIRYLLSKALTMSLLAAVFTLVLVPPMVGWGPNYLHLLAALLVGSLVAALAGFVIGAISGNQIAGIANVKFGILLFLLPAVLTFVIPERFWVVLYWLPTYWSFVAFKAILLQQVAWGALASMLLWNLGASLAFVAVCYPWLKGRLDFARD